MSEDKLNIATLLNLTSELLKIKDQILAEITKEADAKKRRKFNEAIDKVFANPTPDNIIAFRELLFKV